MKVAVAIVHGMGSQKQGFSDALQKGIAKQYQSLGGDWNDLIFQEVLWADLLISQQESLLEKVNYRGDLNYMTLRRFFIEYLADVTAFEPGCGDETAFSPIRNQILLRFNHALESFLAVDGIEEDKTPLVIIAHSLGSVIAFDYCWAHERHAFTPQFSCANTLAGFMTLGSPLALWATRYLQFGHPFDFPGEGLPHALKSRARWYNFYDKDDVVSYPLKGLNPAFESVVSEDISVNVGNPLQFWNPLSHGSYWYSTEIHQRIASFLSTLQELNG